MQLTQFGSFPQKHRTLSVVFLRRIRKCIQFFYTYPNYADVRNSDLSDLLLLTHNVNDLLFGKENAPGK